MYTSTDAEFVYGGTDGITTLPLMGASYPGDLFALAADYSADYVGDDPRHQKVTVNYQSHFDFDPTQINENPLLRANRISVSYERADKYIREDLDGNPIVNAAGSPVDPPQSYTYTIQIIDVKLNVDATTWSISSINGLQEVVNLNAWQGFDPKTVLIRGVEASEIKFENNVYYRELHFVLAIREAIYDGWSPTKILNQGYYEKASDGTLSTIRDKFGNPLPGPSMLDATGTKLTAGEDPVYLEFVLRDEVDFASLGL